MFYLVCLGVEMNMFSKRIRIGNQGRKGEYVKSDLAPTLRSFENGASYYEKRGSPS
jgi:hypothetical protein